MAPEPGAEQGAQPDAPAPAAQAPADGTVPADETAPAQDTAQPGDAAQAEDSAQADGAKKRRKSSFWRDLVIIVIAAIVLMALLKTFVFQVFSIPSQSMENTLLPGDRIVVSKVVYDFRSIARGDVVVFAGAGSWDPPVQPSSNWLVRAWDDVDLFGFSVPGTDYVKRVIGLPGDHVVCCNAKGQVTVNGVALSESAYLYPGAAPSTQPFNITVPAGRLWVMGDNRGDSADSRDHRNDPGGGTIPESAVVGRAFLIIWPFSRASDLPIPNTFKQQGLAAAAAAVASAPPVTVAGGTAFAGAGVLMWRRRRRARVGRRAGR